MGFVRDSDIRSVMGSVFVNGKPRFVYHLRRRRWPRKLVKIHLFVCLVFVSKATENETNREVGKPSLVKLVKHVRLV